MEIPVFFRILRSNVGTVHALVLIYHNKTNVPQRLLQELSFDECHAALMRYRDRYDTMYDSPFCILLLDRAIELAQTFEQANVAYDLLGFFEETSYRTRPGQRLARRMADTAASPEEHLLALQRINLARVNDYPRLNETVRGALQTEDTGTCLKVADELASDSSLRDEALERAFTTASDNFEYRAIVTQFSDFHRRDEALRKAVETIKTFSEGASTYKLCMHLGRHELGGQALRRTAEAVSSIKDCLSMYSQLPAHHEMKSTFLRRAAEIEDSNAAA